MLVYLQNDSDSYTPLHIACDRGHTDIVRLLLSHAGTDINIARITGYTSLHTVCGRGHTDIVRLFIARDSTSTGDLGLWDC